MRVLSVLLAVGLLVGCGGVRRDIALPEAEEVSRVTVTWEIGAVSSGDGAYIARLLEAMGGARNTGQASIHDAPIPDANAWLARIDFAFKGGGESRVFLYPRRGRLYLEQPYQGIYEADGALAELVREVGE